MNSSFNKEQEDTLNKHIMVDIKVGDLMYLFQLLSDRDADCRECDCKVCAEKVKIGQQIGGSLVHQLETHSTIDKQVIEQIVHIISLSQVQAQSKNANEQIQDYFKNHTPKGQA